MSKRLILHIGVHKTGTSAIQSWMEYLAREGRCPVHYARAGRDGSAHHRLVQELQMFGDLSAAVDMRREVLASESDLVVVSAEGMSKLNRAEVEDLFSVFRGADIDLEVLAWLRRPDQYVEAVFSQLVKSGKDARDARKPMMNRVGGGELFSDMLQPWQDVLGEDLVRILPYDRKRWREGSLWAAWWQALGVDAPCAESEMPRSIREANVSPSAMTLAVVAELTRRLKDRQVAVRQMWLFILNVVNPIQERLANQWPDVAAIRFSMFTPGERLAFIQNGGLRRTGDSWWNEDDVLGSASDCNLSWVLDPGGIPEVYRLCYEELLVFAVSLAERCHAANAGVFY
ncbi:hypothetical protein [Sulfuriroseicoccus oceanibius]|uniref:Uncharacterized protein n=1 Tax=Sulfuriroseicoccus oceanibius TaxID=2707525 RepID=A0A6B3L6Y1_9BACT|nr:hypothetical protein [Sulfuriroseicoccus oceanibius]QQL44975.1 hypothetical protein G3M56_014105 [Sulfuriroseicoccus oceanibius]